MKTQLKYRFLEFSIKNQLFQKGDRVLVAVSGGVDSMVLLHLLVACRQRFKMSLGIVHLNHQIRGVEAEKDMKFVENAVLKLKLPFYPIRVNVLEYAKIHHLSLEEAGHRLRKKKFEEIADQNAYTKIATAHHLNDQAETILMRLLSGSGLKGLVGIRLKRGKWVRPLLFARRDEIENYAYKHKIDFRVDSSNKDTSFIRNKIRHQLIPLLEKEYNPQIINHLGNLSNVLVEWDNYLQSEINEAFQKKVLTRFKNKITLELNIFKLYFNWIKFRLIEEVLNLLSDQPYRLTYNQFNSFDTWIQRGRLGSEFEWGKGIYSVKYKDQLVFYNRKLENASERIVQVFPDNWYTLPGGMARICISKVRQEDIELTSDSRNEFIDGGRLKFPLKIRKWKSGDRFRPLGMKQSCLVSDFLTNKKVGLPERRLVAMLMNGEEIVAVLGYEISDLYKITDNTKIVYKINFEKENNEY